MFICTWLRGVFKMPLNERGHLWKSTDAIRLKQAFPEFKKLEKVIYPLLGAWIQGNHPRSRVYLDPGEFGIDLIEVNEENQRTGYEVKMTRIFKDSLDPAPLFQGIGQAIGYFHRLMDYAYLVAPRLEGLEYFPELFKATTRLIGLIEFDVAFEFKEVVKAEKAQFYNDKYLRTITELLRSHKPRDWSGEAMRIKEKWLGSVSR